MKLASSWEDTKATILGISWNKQDHQLEVKFPQHQAEATKRGILQYLASVHDPIGLISQNFSTWKGHFQRDLQSEN